MSDVDIFHAPRDFEFHDFDTRNVTASDGGTATLPFPPVSTPDAVHALAASVRRHRAEKLARYSTDGIVDVIARAVELWTDPEYPERRLAERLIPAVTGYDASMVRIELKRYMRMFRRRELLRFVDDELNCPQMLDEYRPNRSGGYTRLYGPELSFHVFSSNVPGIPVWSMTMGLLTKSAILGKSSFDEPLMPVLFARSLASVDPDMADALAIVPWRGGTVDLEDAAIGEADAVVAYGSSHTTEAIRPRVRAGKPFLSYGAKIGFSLIAARRFAPTCMPAPCIVWRSTWPHTTSKAVWRRKPCSWNVAAPMSPAQVAELLASELDGQQRKYPRSTPSEEESMAIQRLRSTAQMKALMLGAGPMAAAAGNADDAPSDDPVRGAVAFGHRLDGAVLSVHRHGRLAVHTTEPHRQHRGGGPCRGRAAHAAPLRAMVADLRCGARSGPAVRRGATRRRDRHRPHLPGRRDESREIRLASRRRLQSA